MTFHTPEPVGDEMNCMEVWGGNGATNSYLRRPGIDIWLWTSPHRQPQSGGGDLHLVSSCASGRITRVLLADVFGVGSLFEQLSSEFRDLLKRNVNVIRQTRAVRDLTCRLQAASERGAFASTLISTYFAPTRTFTLCNTGHPPPLIYRNDTGEWSMLKQPAPTEKTTASSLGAVDPNEYQQMKTALGLGDLVVSCSNAITECRTAAGHTIGLKGLLERLREIDVAQPDQLPKTLVQHLRAEHEDNLIDEDCTILVCRGTDTPVSWRDNLLAPFRLLRATTDRTHIDMSERSRAEASQPTSSGPACKAHSNTTWP